MKNMTPELFATLLGVYLLLTLPPVIVAWRRGLPARDIRQTFVFGVLLGWTLIGYVAAWFIATDKTMPVLRIAQRITLRDGKGEMEITLDVCCESHGQARSRNRTPMA
ncbi:MAG: superinfection immunity protein [Rhodocyclaceae bacterium]|nr:superinfection immunity protein [Rhodocyclaceae bacterium]